MDLEQQLRVALAPCEPGPAPLAQVMARLSGAGARRSPFRPLLFGAILAAAAAAGMLALQTIRPIEQPPVTLSTDNSAVAEVLDAAAPVVPVEDDVLQVAVATADTAPAGKSFTVLVQPLQFDTDDPATVASVQQYYGFALDELRATPGLELIVAGLPESAPADFRLTMTGQDVGDTELLAGRARWQVELNAESWQNDAFSNKLRIQSGGTLDLGSCPFAAELAASMCTPSGVAARNIQDLRRSLFPTNPVLREELQARLRDSSQSSAGRNQALLAMLSQWRPGDAPLDGNVIRGVLDLIAGTDDASRRASLWRQLRGQKHPELVQPLIDASHDESGAIRLEVVTMLASDFSDAPGARAALDWVAGTDPELLVRKVAERALHGDEAWRDYVVSSVKDASLPVAGRFEALDWMLRNKRTDATIQATMNAVAPALLDSDAGALADVLVGASKEKTGGLGGLNGLAVMEYMGSVNHPAVPELLIDCFDGMPGDISLHFLAQHRDDPRVQRKLRDVAANHADQKLREKAAAYLRGSAESGG